MKVSLLIAEDRTHFTKSMLARRRPANEVVVLSQHSGESRRDFHERVTERLARLRRCGPRLDEVLLVASAERDSGALLARAQMLGVVFAELDDDTRILLGTGANEDPGAWKLLRALVETVVALAAPVARHIEWFDAGSATAWGNA